MSCIFHDSFGSLTTARWSGAINGSPTINNAHPRFTGSRYLTIGSTSQNIQHRFTATNELYIGDAVYVAGGNSANVTFQSDGDTVNHITVRVSSAMKLEIRLGGDTGTILATGTTTLTANTWYHRQVHVKIADSGGVVEVRLNGTLEVAYTGDTRNGGSATTDAIIWWLGSSVNAYDLTDAYIFNTAGTVNNTWGGDLRTITLTPTGNGNASGFTGSDGNQVNNYDLVDELPASSSDYVAAIAASNARDSYAMSDVPVGTTAVKAVTQTIVAAKSDSAAANITPSLRIGGVDYDGSSLGLSVSYVTSTRVLENSPATGTAWTPAEINGMEAGVKAA